MNLFRKPKPAPVPAPAWESMTFGDILPRLPKPGEVFSNQSLVALLNRLDEIAFLDGNAPERDRVDASKLADALEQDLVGAHPEAANAVSEARAGVRRIAARNHYAQQVTLEANKIAAAIRAPSIDAILLRLDGTQEQRQAMVNALDAAIASNITPEQAAPGILFGLLGAVGENAAAERLTQKIVADSPNPPSIRQTLDDLARVATHLVADTEAPNDRVRGR